MATASRGCSGREQILLQAPGGAHAAHLRVPTQPPDRPSKPPGRCFVGSPGRPAPPDLSGLLQPPRRSLPGGPRGPWLWLNVLFPAQASTEAPSPGLTWLWAPDRRLKALWDMTQHPWEATGRNRWLTITFLSSKLRGATAAQPPGVRPRGERAARSCWDLGTWPLQPQCRSCRRHGNNNRRPLTQGAGLGLHQP